MFAKHNRPPALCRRNNWWPVIACIVLSVAALPAQRQVTSRKQQIEQQRRAKRARLYPERESGFAKKVNKLAERGLFKGFQGGKGANGLQLVAGGMRSGQGVSFGVGYRRSDLWRHHLDFRTTARASVWKAYMFDMRIGSQNLKTGRPFLIFYTKYENSPQMDYYGPGPNSDRHGRSSYRFEDTKVDLSTGYELMRHLKAGATGGVLLANTGRGQRGGVPSTEQVYNPATTPGLDQQTNFVRWGGFLDYDYRDNPGGPKVGGHYYGRFTRFSDRDLGLYNFSRLEAAAEQYIPYFNRTRVIALRLAAVMTYAKPGQAVPFYLQPRLGGNKLLRGFARQRFYDQNMMIATVEHRWHIFSDLHAALFFEAGKVAHKASQLNFHNLEYSGGLGFRFTVRDTVLIRVDNAVSREGYRIIWTFSNMW